MGEMTLEVMMEVMLEVRAEVMEEVIVAMEVLLPEALECWVTFLCFSTILPFPPPPPVLPQKATTQKATTPKGHCPKGHHPKRPLPQKATTSKGHQHSEMPKKVTTSKGLKGSTIFRKKTMLLGQKKICQPGSLHYFILTAGFRQLIQLQVCCETSPGELNLVRLYSRKLGTAVICGFVFPKSGFLFQKPDLFSEKRIFFFSLV